MKFGSQTPTSQTSRSSEVGSSTPPPPKSIWGFVSYLISGDEASQPPIPQSSFPAASELPDVRTKDDEMESPSEKIPHDTVDGASVTMVTPAEVHDKGQAADPVASLLAADEDIKPETLARVSVISESTPASQILTDDGIIDEQTETAAEMVSSIWSSTDATAADSQTAIIEPYSGGSLTSIDLHTDIVPSHTVSSLRGEETLVRVDAVYDNSSQSTPVKNDAPLFENQKDEERMDMGESLSDSTPGSALDAVGDTGSLEDVVPVTHAPHRDVDGTPRSEVLLASAFSAEGDLPTPHQEEFLEVKASVIDTMVHTVERSSPDNEDGEGMDVKHCVVCGRRGLTVHSSKTRWVSV